MAEMEDGFTESSEELAACALYNLENLTKFVPGLNEHPIYQIAHAQAKALSERLSKV